MRILIAANFRHAGGESARLAHAERSLLGQHGHEARLFSPEADGCTPSLGRVLGRDGSASAFSHLLDDFRPDVVHLHSFLPPALGETARARGIRVVWTLHDYRLVCPAGSCRLPSGDNCDACLHGRLRALRHRCVGGSRAASLLAELESRVWNRRRISSFTDTFIAPSRFLSNKLIEGGYPADRMIVIPGFVSPQPWPEAAPGLGDFFLYSGPLSEETGILTLLNAAAEAGVSLKVAGSGPLAADLSGRFSLYPGIEFVGDQSGESLAALTAAAAATVVPSEGYEVHAPALLRSLCAGTPVIGSGIGAIPELLDRSNGVLFTPGNAEELTQLLRRFHQLRRFDRRAIRTAALERFGPERHYINLMKAYAAEP